MFLANIGANANFCWMLEELYSIGQGKYFGEMALLDDKPRGATIKCLSNTLFAVMTAKDYQKILQKAI